MSNVSSCFSFPSFQSTSLVSFSCSLQGVLTRRSTLGHAHVTGFPSVVRSFFLSLGWSLIPPLYLCIPPQFLAGQDSARFAAQAFPRFGDFGKHTFFKGSSNSCLASPSSSPPFPRPYGPREQSIREISRCAPQKKRTGKKSSIKISREKKRKQKQNLHFCLQEGRSHFFHPVYLCFAASPVP